MTSKIDYDKRYGEVLRDIPEIIQTLTFKTAEDVKTALDTLQDINSEILKDIEAIYNGEGNDAFWLFRTAKALGQTFIMLYQAYTEQMLIEDRIWGPYIMPGKTKP